MSCALTLAFFFVVIPDSWFLNSSIQSLAVSVMNISPKLKADMTTMAQVNIARAIQLAILMGLCTLIGVALLCTNMFMMFRLSLEKPWPYYIRLVNLLLTPLTTAFFWWFTYFSTSVSSFDSTVRAGRGIFYTDVGLVLFSACSVLCFLGISRTISLYCVMIKTFFSGDAK
jgi:hypothetical protein